MDWTFSTDNFTGAPNNPLTGVANFPVKGSIKGVYLSKRAICSAEAPIQPILASLDLGFLAEFTKSVSDAEVDFKVAKIGIGPFISTQNEWIHSVAFTAQGQTSASPPNAGFVFNFSERVIWDRALLAPILGPVVATLSDVTIRVNETYRWTLANGILSVRGAENKERDSGTASGTIVDKVRPALADQLPAKVFDAALNQQAAPIPAVRPPEGVDCNPLIAQRDPGCFALCQGADPNNPDPNTFKQSFCQGGARLVLTEAIINGGAKLNLSSNTITQLQDVAFQTFTDASGTDDFVHIRCNFTPGYVRHDPTAKPPPVCEYVVSAHSVQGHPDSVELTFFDAPSLTDFSNADPALFANPAFPIFVALNETLTNPPGDPSQLCRRRPAGGHFVRRYAHDELVPAP